jgi:hypothetical protein
MVPVISKPLKNHWFYIRFFNLFMHVSKPWLCPKTCSLDFVMQFFQTTVMFQIRFFGLFAHLKHTVMYQTCSLGFLHT